MGVVVYLGNHQPVQNTLRLDGSGKPDLAPNGAEQYDRVPLDGKQCTRAIQPDDMPAAEFIAELTLPGRVWSAHSDADTPAWVACDDPDIAARLAAYWGCEIRPVDDGARL